MGIKKIGILVLSVLCVTCTVNGCSGASSEDVSQAMKESVVGETQVDGKLECIEGNYICSEWKDMETGVHYFYTLTGGLEARLNADGTPYVD